MKNIAIGILLLILLSVLLQPLIEISNVMREKVLLSSAMNNASRVARDSSYTYEFHRDLHGVLDLETFRSEFSEVFQSAMEVKRTSTVGNTMIFTSDNDKFHPIHITLDFREETDYLTVTEQTTTIVDITAETKYKFKRRLLALAESAGFDLDYYLIEERKFILQVKN